MRHVRAYDAVIRLAASRDGQRISRGAVEDEEDFAVGGEQLAQPVGDDGRVAIVAVGGLRPRIRCDEGLERLGASAGRGCRWRIDSLA